MRLLLIAALCLLALRAPGVTPADLRQAERFANAFAKGNMGDAERFLSATASAPALRDLRKRLAEEGGALRYVQAAYAAGAQDPRLHSAAIPLDFENAEVDLLVDWRGELRERAVVAFRIRNRVPRPLPGAAAGAPAEPLFFDAAYVLDHAYRETTATLGSPPLEVRLAIPAGTGRVPAILILGDRPAPDADGSRGPNKPLRDWGRGLASRGFATLRIPLRIDARPGELPPLYTLEEGALADARVALKLLGGHPRVDPARVFVLGTGLGATAACALAERFPALGGIVAVGLAERHDGDLLLRAFALDAAYAPAPQGDDLAILRGQRGFLDDRSAARDELFHREPMAWWYSLLDVSPGRALAGHGGAALFLFGANDALSPKAERVRWRDFAAARPAAMAFAELKGLNRELMQDAATISRMPRHVSAEAIDTVAKFIEWSEPARRAKRE